MIVVVGLSHRNAPVSIRERVAIPRSSVPDVLARLMNEGAVGEAVVLSTCNRVEIYAAARRDAGVGELDAVARAVSSVLLSLGGDAIASHLIQATGRSAVLHLFRVAASLDSLVVGEPQILGQLKGAVEVAREAQAIGRTLGTAMRRAIRVGKRVRTETAIGAGQVSVSSVAIDMARQIFSDLEGRSALLVGAGEMAESAAKLLARAGARIRIANRSPERAATLAREIGGEARPFGELDKALVEADIVITSTSSPGYVITQDLVKGIRRARKGRSLFLIDIAVPRDVDPAVNKLDNVFLYDVDDLSQIVAQSLSGRASEAERAETIAAEEATSFETWTLEQALTPAIVGLRSRTRSVLAAEVERSLSGKLRHLGAPEREALGAMIDAATNKLLHGPVTRLRSLAADPRAEDYLEALCELFDLPAARNTGEQDEAGSVARLPTERRGTSERSSPGRAANGRRL